MNRDRVLALWAQYLAGESLAEADQRLLLDVLQNDAELGALLISEAEMHGVLDSRSRVQADGELFLKSYQEFQANEGDATRFIRKLESRIQEKLPPDGPGPSGKAPDAQETEIPRIHSIPWRARRINGSRQESYLVPFLGAAVLLVGLLFFFFNGTDSRRSLLDTKRPQTVQRRTEDSPPSHPAPERKETVQEELPREKVPPPVPPPTPPRDQATALLEPKKESPPPRPPEKNSPAAPKETPETATPPTASEPRESPPTATSKTELVVATVERVQGDVVVIDHGDRSLVKPGHGIRSGQGLESLGAGSRLVFVYPDKTRLELGPATTVTGILDRESSALGRGKRLTLQQGTLAANVSKQPLDQPMIFLTPHGEAKVLGTTLRIAVHPDPKQGTRLDVEEGKVELKNQAGKSLSVTSGYSGVVATGVEFVPIPILLFADSFERGDLGQWHTPPGAKWRILKDPSGPGAVLGGGPARGGPGDRERMALQCGSPAWQDYALEASVRYEGKVAGGVLLMARMRGSDNCYWFEYKVSDTGMAGVYLFKMLNRNGVSLNVDPTAAPLVSPGQWFRLRFEVEGKRLRGYMNGNLVAEAQDGDLPSGGSGLTLSDPPNPASAILWSNVRVENLSLPKK